MNNSYCLSHTFSTARERNNHQEILQAKAAKVKGGRGLLCKFKVLHATQPGLQNSSLTG